QHGGQAVDDDYQSQKMTETRINIGCQPARKKGCKKTAQLPRVAGTRLTVIVAARIQRAAQRTNVTCISGAVSHILTFEFMFTDTAVDGALGRRYLNDWACDVIPALCAPGDEWRNNQGGEQGDKVRQCLRDIPHNTQLAGDADNGSHQHAAEANGVDVIQMSAFELDMLRAEAQGFVDYQIRHLHPQPCHLNNDIHTECLLQRVVNYQLHQQQGNGDIEHQPHHTARMTVRQA